jgi:hypothetical protein
LHRDAPGLTGDLAANDRDTQLGVALIAVVVDVVCATSGEVGGGGLLRLLLRDVGLELRQSELVSARVL